MAVSIPGSLSVSNDVVADMVGYAALESYGVVGMSMPTLTDGIAKLLPASRMRRGVDVQVTDEGVHVDLYIIVEHGTNLTEVSRMLAEKVQYVLEDSAQLTVTGVEIHIQGIRTRN